MAEGRKNRSETREEQLISIIASCDESIAHKRHMNVCKKTKEDAEKELARIAAAKIDIQDRTGQEENPHHGTDDANPTGRD